MENVASLKQNVPEEEWSMQYKVRRYNSKTRALEYINVPVLANAMDVVGDNARYFDNTAGLLVNAKANSFGTTSGIDESVYKTSGGTVQKYENGTWTTLTESFDIDEALKTLLNYDATHARDNINYITIQNGQSLTIPNLKAGQYVRVKWSRYAENQGDRVTLSNLMDLNGTSMDGVTIDIGAGGSVDNDGGTGCHEFKVKADGDVTFTVSQDGWVNIYEIDVSNEFIDTELRLYVSNGNYKEDVKRPGKQKEAGWQPVPKRYFRKKGVPQTITQEYTVDYGGTLSQSNVNVTYRIKEGTPTGTLGGKCQIVDRTDINNENVSSSKLIINDASGYGRVTVIQECKIGDYLLDRKEYVVKVYEYEYDKLDYPHTWNMKHVTEDTGNHTVADLTTDAAQRSDSTNHYYTYWNANDGTPKTDFTLKIGYPENIMAWYYKTTNNGTTTAVPELNGLGIIPNDMADEEDISIVFKAGNGGQGLMISNQKNTIVVPTVLSGETVYVAASGSGSISINGTEQSGTTVGDTKVYVIPGSGDDVNLEVQNMTINQIAVSKDTKTITAAGYATEARDYNLDFSLNQTLTGNGVTAYKVTGVNSNGQVLKSETPYVPTYVDVTDKVATDGWGNGTGYGLCSAQYAPAVVTSDGRSTQMWEKFVGNADGVNETGDILSQTVTGLENGNYSVELYANAMTTADRDNFESDLVDGAMDVAYVFANNSEVPIVARRTTSTTENGVYALEAEVTNGTLTLGLRKNKAGTNWHTIQIKRLTKGQMQGVLLQGSQGDHPLFTWDVNRTSSEMADNKLIGAITPPVNNVWQKEIINGTTYYNYMLAASGFVETTKENGNVIVDENNVVNGIGFYLVYQQGALINGAPYAGGKPKANSAYLQLDSYQAQHQEIGGSTPVRAYFFIDKEDEATGIQSTIATPVKKDAWYTLQGVRIDNPAKGLYIRNGKKVFVK